MDEASIEAELDSLWKNVKDHAGQIRMLEKALDTRATPLWRRAVFRVDGWPSWAVVAKKPAWRPWRRWWTS